MCSGGVGFLESTLRTVNIPFVPRWTNLHGFGMRHTGNRLVVEVMERTPEPEMQNTRKPSNIIASQDGQIVSVSIYRGQLMKIVGDPVQKGDLLVSGLYTDETGHTGIKHAMGSSSGSDNKQKNHLYI